MQIKNYNISLTALSVLLILTVSCKKDNSEPSVKRPKCMIDSIEVYTYEEWDGQVYDEDTRTSVYTYDEKNRLTEWRIVENGLTRKIYYDAKGRLEKIEVWSPNYMWDYTTFTWEGNKATSQDFEDFGNGFEPANYREVVSLNSRNEIVRVDGYYNDDGNWTQTDYVVFTWENGNLVKMEHFDVGKNGQYERARRNLTNQDYRNKKDISETERMKNRSDNVFLHGNTFVITYDNNNNPFEPFLAFGIYAPGWSWLYLSQNNPISIKNVEDEFQTNIDYEYNTHGFPATMNIVDDEGGLYIERWTFDYDCD